MQLILRTLGLCLFVGTTSAAAGDFGVPSGTEMELHEVLLDIVEEQDWARFRFVAPSISRSGEDAPDYFRLVNDFPVLCNTIALPYLAEYKLQPVIIAISLSDRVVEFGTADPDATQYFELFSVQDGDCIWEEF